MKRIYALLAVACALLAGCNKDKDGISDRPESGFYLYESNTLTVRLHLDTSASLTIYVDGRSACSPTCETALNDAGTWPSYTFEFVASSQGSDNQSAGTQPADILELTLQCLFSDSSHFTGTVIKNTTAITLPSVMQFSLGDNPDADADGLLDS